MTRELEKIGVKDKCVLHVTDEPCENDLETYAKCREIVKKYSDIPVLDALSNYSFYKRGYVDLPAVLIDSAEAFYENGIGDFLLYTCCLPAGG